MENCMSCIHANKREWEEPCNVCFYSGMGTVSLHSPVLRKTTREEKISNPGVYHVHNESALDVQVAGDHYKQLKIQPVEYIHANNIPFIEGCIIKYASRWRDKGGTKDLEKIKHFADLLIELESKNGW